MGQHSGLGEVAASTVAAAHRRDHEHADGEVCHPHAVEVVNLGLRAVMVCHDCHLDSGFIDHHEAEQLAATHRSETREEPPTAPGPDRHAA